VLRGLDRLRARSRRYLRQKFPGRSAIAQYARISDSACLKRSHSFDAKSHEALQLDAKTVLPDASADDPRVVSDHFAAGVEDGFAMLDGDLAGDGFNDAKDGGTALALGLRGLRTAGHVGADLVNESGVAVRLPGFLDQDLAGVERDGLDGAVVEVDDVGRDEEEDQDQRHHHVVVKAAAFIGPEEIAAKKFT